MIRKLFFIMMLVVLVSCSGDKEQGSSYKWSFVKGPSGTCYEVGTQTHTGGFSFSVYGKATDAASCEEKTKESRNYNWTYLMSPSGICYEVGTWSFVGGFSLTASGQVDKRYCQ